MSETIEEGTEDYSEGEQDDGLDNLEPDLEEPEGQ